MEAHVHPKSIVILDFGGQYAHLIGNRIRRLGAFSEIREAETPAKELKEAAGIILSGGPQSVYDKGSPQADKKIFDLGIPILGICYGHQWIAHVLGGEVKPGKTKEYGSAEVKIVDSVLFERPEGTSRSAKSLSTRSTRSRKTSGLFEGLPKTFTVWMSHGDTVTKLPGGFQTIASSPDCEVAAMENSQKKIFGTQFHLEVTHTERGMEILEKFVRLCKAAPWSIEDFAAHVGEQVKREVGDRPHSAPQSGATRGKKVFMLVSGGVDSTVAFTLLNKILGKDRVYGLLVDTGLMRKNEVQQISASLAKLGFTNLHVEDASELFFERLKNIYDPEEKRRVIGQAFLEVQRNVAKRLKLDGPEWMLGQGTIYPDTIETGGTKHAERIKTHHNRVEEIQKMIREERVIEPLKDLYKDEVRRLGEELGLPHELVARHPFPGPGLAVRILCAERENLLSPEQEETISVRSDLFAFRVLPIKSVGVQGDGRTYRHPLVIFMKRMYSDLQSLHALATSLPNRHREINRVLLCTSHNTPAPFTFTSSCITRERANLLRDADAIVDEEMRKAKLYESIWQFPVVLLPIGMRQGGLPPEAPPGAKGGQSIVLRPVDSTEAMTANATRLPKEFLEKVTKKLLALPGVNMVFYDLTNKPPATIEWE